ncbi:hypothetical protein KUTeg_024744 [Tegillarca granosa]|uniref:Uncharacterized protein n=1 Tax=Tegillarca granosa TaxID=220873 RepID=A0ABQ9E4H2_TEGGR|nr:hypothetical protein KUTeg_024744 [Tegillarca granosa]
MESFRMENGPKDNQKSAGRKYLILAIINIVTAALLFIVVLTIIIVYEENKQLYIFQNQNATLYTSQNEEWSTSQLQPSRSSQTTFFISERDETVLLSQYDASYSRGFSDSTFYSEHHTMSSHFKEQSLSFSSVVSSYEIYSSMNTPSDGWSPLPSPVISTEFISTEIHSTLPSIITEKTSTFLTSELVTMATAVISSTAVCQSHQYQCKDNTCISSLLVCDGTPNCPDASDESPDCECSVDQFQCKSGQCVLSSHRCDRYRHCLDGTDEANCSNCVGFECGTGLCLWTWTSYCNGVVDCVDLSDEKQCPFKPGFRRCSNGLWIRSEDWCNGLDDCYDNSDETQCRDCEVSEVMCSDYGYCNRQEWLCDGHFDCTNGIDENNCSNCSADQFTCRDYTCVDIYDTCDGVFDCPDGSDEESCVILKGDNSTSGIAVISFRGNSYFICSTYWTKNQSDHICHLTGHEFSKETVSTNISLQVNTTDLLQLRNPVIDLTNSFMQNFKIVTSCDTDTIISVNCMPKAI